MRGLGEVEPPHREDDERRADEHRREVRRDGAEVEGALHGQRRRQHRLAQHDEGEQLVALGDVPRVPGRPPGPLGVERHADLGHDHDEEAQVGRPLGQQQEREPADHAHGDAGREAQARAAVRRVPVGGAQPLGDESDAHDRIAVRHDGEVVVVGARDPGGEDEHARDLHERRQPVGHVVAVVRRREPREVHPRPPDGEEHRRRRSRGRPARAPRPTSGGAARRPGRRPPRSRGRRRARAASTPGGPRRPSGHASDRPRSASPSRERRQRCQTWAEPVGSTPSVSSPTRPYGFRGPLAAPPSRRSSVSGDDYRRHDLAPGPPLQRGCRRPRAAAPRLQQLAAGARPDRHQRPRRRDHHRAGARAALRDVVPRVLHPDGHRLRAAQRVRQAADPVLRAALPRGQLRLRRRPHQRTHALPAGLDLPGVDHAAAASSRSSWAV